MLARVFVEVDIAASLAVLLQALMGRVLLAVGLLSLLVGIDLMGLGAAGLMQIAGFRVAGALVTLVLLGNWRCFRHAETPSAV